MKLCRSIGKCRANKIGLKAKSKIFMVRIINAKISNYDKVEFA